MNLENMQLLMNGEAYRVLSASASARDLDSPQNDLGWNLELGDEYLRLSDGLGGILYVLSGEAAVCARGDRDRVLPVRGDGYESRTRRRTGRLLHKARIDTLFGERPYQRLAEPVVANAAKECHVSTE